MKLKEECYEKLLCMIKYMIFVCRHHSFEIKKTPSVPIFLSLDWIDGEYMIVLLNVESFIFSKFWNINLISDLKQSFIMKEANRSKFNALCSLSRRNSYFTRNTSYKLRFLHSHGKGCSLIVLNKLSNINGKLIVCFKESNIQVHLNISQN